MTIKFEIGKKYKFRGEDGWAKPVAHVPEANEDSRLLFMDDSGYIHSRFEDGKVIRNRDLSHDIIPEEYTEPVVPKKVMMYPALCYDDYGYWISSSLFQTEEEARTNHGRTFARLLTDRGVEVEE